MADMQTIYVRINWENSPSSATALGATNLNKMDLALSTIDGRVVSINTTKLDVATANTMVQNVTVDANGVFTITKLDGTTTTYDTKIEKIAVNFAYDEETQRLVLTLEDGTIQYVDLSSLVSDLDFTDSDTIDFTVTNGVVSAIVKDGSITGAKLQPNYLADVTVQAQNASNSASSALTSEQNATTQATKSQSYAIGGTGSRVGEDTDNAKYYKEQAQLISGLDTILNDTTASLNQTYSSTKIEAIKSGLSNDLTQSINDVTTEADVYYNMLAKVVIKTTDDPQTVFDETPPYSIITFEGGTHTHGLSKYNSFLYIDKPMKIIIPPTAELKVADGSMLVNKHADLITNFHADNPILNLEIDSSGFTQGENVRTYEITIDGTSSPNTFHYQIRDFHNAVLFTSPNGIAITGNFQSLADGITIKFPQTTGYTLNAGCIVAVGSVGYSVIRVGMGTQSDYIDGVQIEGTGVINQNQTNNAYSNLYALWLNNGLLINGRVSNFKMNSQIRFRDCNRSIIVLGENVGGTKNLDGTITGGTSYDVDKALITNTMTESSCISGVLFGMPEHRGYIKNLIFESNEIHCNLTAIEPNNLCQNYIVRNNTIYVSTDGVPISCWRYSKNGVIEDNKAYGYAETDIVMQSAPYGWKEPENIYENNNINMTTFLSVKNYGVLPLLNCSLYIYQDIPSGVATQLSMSDSTIEPYDSEIYGVYDGTGITVKKSGWYDVNIICTWNGNNVGDRAVLTKIDDDAYHARAYAVACATANATTTNLVDRIKLNANQKIKFYVLQTSGGVLSFSNLKAYITKVA